MPIFLRRIWSLILIAGAIVWGFAIYGVSKAVAEEPPTPQLQALSNRIIIELNANLACNANVIDLQKQLADAKVEKAKAEPKKEN